MIYVSDDPYLTPDEVAVMHRKLRQLCDRVHAPGAPCGMCRPGPAGEWSNAPTYLRERLVFLEGRRLVAIRKWETWRIPGRLRLARLRLFIALGTLSG